MNKIKLGLYALLLITVFASCEDLLRGSILEVELPAHESKLAPYAFFKDTDSVLVVKVGKSVGVLDTINPDVVLGATVELFKNGNLEYTFVYNPISNAYEVDLGQPFAAVEGDEYELRVSKEGFETSSAIQRVPRKVTIDTAEIKLGGGVDQFGNTVDIVNLTFTDPANVNNYYEFGGSVNVIYRDPFDSSIVYQFENTLNFDSNDPNYENGILSDIVFDGQQYMIRLESYLSFFAGSDNVEFTGQISMYSTTAEYAAFIRSLNAYWNADGNPFAEPVILYSNTSTNLGVFGILVTHSIDL